MNGLFNNYICVIMKKRLFTTLLAVLALAGAATAQPLRVGVRGGINMVDYSFRPVDIGERTFSPGDRRPGYDAGLVLRLRLARRLDLQSGLDYSRVDYGFRMVQNDALRKLNIVTERLEVPAELGIHLGVFRIFGGARFRLKSWQHSSNKHLLTVDFSDSKVALSGGVGLNIRKFFLEFRLTGYPGSVYHDTFRSGRARQRVAIRSSVIYGASMGFFF